MTNIPEGNTPPPEQAAMRSRPSDVVSETPVIKGPGAESGAPGAGTGPRPGTVTADTPALAAERTARVTETMDEVVAGAAPMTTDQIMPSCMIYSMFGTLALLLGMMLLWWLTNIPDALMR